MAKKSVKLSKAAEARVANYQAKSTLVGSRDVIRKKDNLRSLLIAAAAIVVAVSAQLAYFNFGPGVPTPTPTPTTASAPSPDLAENRAWAGTMNINGSPVSFDLVGDKAPQAVASFVSLSQSGFFENISCHRLTTEGIFVLQCGDPSGTGSGGPGYKFGPIENAPADDLYQNGVLAMARQSNAGDSMGSQFFIVYADSTIPADSAGGYTVFGKVTKNLGVVTKIAEVGNVDDASDGSPKSKVLLTSVTVK